MKKFLILFFMFCALPALAETISAVSFNPMRVGHFYYSLKASEGIIARGGLYVWNESGSLCEGVSDGTLEVRGNTAKINNLTTPKMYEIETVNTLPMSLAWLEAGNGEAKVSFPNMMFRNKNGPETSTVDLSNPHSWPGIATKITSHGGLATFGHDSQAQVLDFPTFDISSSVDCYTQSTTDQTVVAKDYADCANRMLVYAKNFQMPNVSNRRFDILGSDVAYYKGRVVLMGSDFNPVSHTRGLRLGGVDIQKPKRAVYTTDYDNVTGWNGSGTGTMPPNGLSGCCFKWSPNHQIVGESSKMSVLYLACGNQCSTN